MQAKSHLSPHQLRKSPRFSVSAGADLLDSIKNVGYYINPRWFLLEWQIVIVAFGWY